MVPGVRFVKPVHSPAHNCASFALKFITGVGSKLTFKVWENVDEPRALLTVKVVVYDPELAKQNWTGEIPVCKGFIAPGHDHDHCVGFPVELSVNSTHVVVQPGLVDVTENDATGAIRFTVADCAVHPFTSVIIT